MEEINRLLGVARASNFEVMGEILMKSVGGCPRIPENCFPEVSPDYEDRINFLSACYEWKTMNPKMLPISVVIQVTLQVAMIVELTKNSEVSAAVRTKGNELFGQGNFEEALKLYNLAIMFADPSGGELGLAFANRSALFLEQKDPACSLKDIELALKNNYPERLMAKLKKRREKCTKMLQDIERSYLIEDVQSDMASRRKFRDEELLKLRSPNPQIPSAEDFVNIEYTEHAGRQLVVNKDVPVGTVVMVERPFTSVSKGLLKFEEGQHCNTCYKFVKNGIPCKRCVFVMYCSEECRSNAELEHDNFECKSLSSLYLDSTDAYTHLAFRIICKVGPEELYRLFTTRDPNYFEAKKPFGTVPGSTYASDSYLSIHHLLSHTPTLDSKSLYDNGMRALKLVSILEARTKFFGLSPKDKRNDFKNFVAAILLRLKETVPHNGIGIEEIQALRGLTLTDVNVRKDAERTMREALRCSENGSFFDRPFLGIYCVESLMNHSCDPNIIRVNDVSHGTMAVVTTRGLKKGEPLTTSYGATFHKSMLLIRQIYLRSGYHFDCQCVACKNNWPIDAVLQMNIKNPEFTCPSCSKKFDHEEKGSGEFIRCCLNNSRTTCNLCDKSYKKGELDQSFKKAMMKFHQGNIDLCNNRPFQSLKASKEIVEYLQFNVRPPHGMAADSELTIHQALALILHFTE